jgi:hypothetical protein
MRKLPDQPVFSRADARVLGWTDPALTRAARSGRINQLRRDQFTASSPDSRLAAIAAVRGCRGAVISHRSAAIMHGLPLVGPLPPVPDVTVPPSGTGDLAAAHLYRATMRPEDIVEIDRCPVLSVPRTIVDLGRHRPMATAVAAADFALHEGLTTLDELAATLEFCRRWPRAERAARALRHVDGRAESPLESISRLVFVWLRLPAPKPQQRIRNERGVIIARTDFYWDEYGVVGEADGKSKLQRKEDLDAAWDRHDDLDDLGLVVVRWGWTEAVRMPRVLGAKVQRGFERGRRRDALGLPRRWSLAAA